METGQTHQSLVAPRFPFQLQDVRVFEISAVIRETPIDDEAGLPLELGLVSDDSPPDAEEFGLLLTFKTEIPLEPDKAYAVHLAVEGKFRVIVDFAELNADVLDQFKTRDAIVLLWPYLRQIFHDLTTKMRLDIDPLPVLDARTLVGRQAEDGKSDDSQARADR